MTTVNIQRISSLGRQALAIAGIVFAILTQSDSALHLSPVVSAWMGVGGAVILAVEHYVSDPSTGSTTAVPTPVAPKEVG
jgi:hypothetical protein